MSKRAAKRVERLLITIYALTKGRGREWQKVKRLVMKLGSGKQLRWVIAARVAARFILEDMTDGTLDGFLRLWLM